MRGVRKSNVRRHAAAELAFRIVEPHLHAEDQLHAFVREADAKLSELVTLVDVLEAIVDDI